MLKLSMIGAVFGVRTPSYDTPHMTKLYALMENWSKVMETGATPPIDIYPFLKLIPQRFLGKWVSRATEVREEMDALYGDVVRHVIRRQETVGSKSSFMDRVLEKKDKLGLSMHELYFLGGVAMEGGSDTSSSVIISCIQAMTKWPEIQKKAQEEIDGMVGEDRSPVWSDYAKLPYVAAIVKESMRWRPVAPLGFPHSLSEGTGITTAPFSLKREG
jgi:cytochrome P450